MEPRETPVPGRVLVTGATGFIGSALARRLVAEGREVHATRRATSDLTSVGDAVDAITWHLLDGTTPTLAAAVARAQPETCFHLAAMFRGRHSAEDITGLVESNVLLGTQLADALTQNHAKFLVNTGTIWQHHGGATYAPVALYAATRQALADILRFYADTTPMRILTLELPGTYGFGDWRAKVLNLLRDAAASGLPLAMSGGAQTLDLLHVDDAVDAYLHAESLLRAGTTAQGASFLASSGAPLTLRELVARFETVAGRRIDARWGELPYAPREMFEPWSAPRLPGWVPHVSLEQGLRAFLGLPAS